MNINKELTIVNDKVKLKLDFQLEDFHLDFIIENKIKIDWSQLFNEKGLVTLHLVEQETVIGFSREDNILKISVLFNKKNYVTHTVIYRYIENEIKDLDEWFKKNIL